MPSPAASDLDGRCAVVTGAAGEIGAAIAARLAGAGAKVLAVDRDGDGLRRTIAAADGDVHPFVADVVEAGEVAAYARAGAELGGGRIDLFANNAGVVGPVAELTEFPDAGFDRVIAVNVRGVFLGLKHVLPLMEAGAAALNTASTAGLIGSPGLAAYVASKHAVIGLTKTAALEQAGRGVRVNALCPGPVESRMMDAIETGKGLDHARAAALTPLGRYATLEEVAALAHALLSPALGACTGAAFTADGGQTAA